MKNKKAFTLIELLVVIGIIGLLATMSIIALNTARARARDAKRVADIKQIQTALEMYYNAEGKYPASMASLATAYMAMIPKNPEPNDGTCGSDGYVYTSTVSNSYTLKFCLGSKTGNLDAGTREASPAGIGTTTP